MKWDRLIAGFTKHFIVSAVFGALILSLIVATAQAGPTTIALNDNDGHSVSSPRINDSGQVVWCGSGGSDGGDDYEIFLYSGGMTTQLTSNSEYELDPQINDSGQVVWSGTGGSDGGDDYEIFLYSNGATTQLTSNDFRDDFPGLNDSGQVVWQGMDGPYDTGDFEIFLYSGGTTTQLTDNGTWDTQAMINDSGQVAWQGFDDYYGGGDLEIFLYNGGTTTQLSNNFVQDSAPLINESGQVLWQGRGGSDSGDDFEIFLYSGGTTTQLTSNTYDDWRGDINDLGQVVYSGSGGLDYGGDREVYLYSASSTTQITVNSYQDYPSSINNAGKIAWIHSPSYDQQDVFIYADELATRLSTFTAEYDYDDLQLNEQGQAVWSSRYQVFLSSGETCFPARPDIVLSLDPSRDIDDNLDGVFWAHYADYTAGYLSIQYKVTNNGPGTAYAVSVTGSSASGGVTLDTLWGRLLSVGDMAEGDSFSFRYRYNVPAGISSFMTTVNANAQDECDYAFDYPEN